MKFFVIGDEHTVTGFSLVGVQGAVAQDGKEAGDALERVTLEKEAGVILITERLAAEIREQVNQHVYAGRFPLVVEIPDRKGPLENRLDVREVVRRSIGVSV